MEEKIVREVHILTHPLRYRILEFLAANPDGIHISRISDLIKEDRRLVSWHLLALEENEFVKGRYEISKYPESKGKAIKKYVLTGKTRSVLNELAKEIALGSIL